MKTGNALAIGIAAAAFASGGLLLATTDSEEVPVVREFKAGKIYRDISCIDFSSDCKGIAEYSEEFGCLVCPARD